MRYVLALPRIALGLLGFTVVALLVAFFAAARNYERADQLERYLDRIGDFAFGTW
jgi:hypothetical protein